MRSVPVPHQVWNDLKKGITGEGGGTVKPLQFSRVVHAIRRQYNLKSRTREIHHADASSCILKLREIERMRDGDGRIGVLPN
jgi:hypothetical protein